MREKKKGLNLFLDRVGYESGFDPTDKFISLLRKTEGKYLSKRSVYCL